MIAQYRQNSIHTLVHSFETNGTRWQFRMSAQGHSIVPYFDSGYKNHMTNHIWFQRVVGSTIEGFIELARCTLKCHKSLSLLWLTYARLILLHRQYFYQLRYYLNSYIKSTKFSNLLKLEVCYVVQTFICSPTI